MDLSEEQETCETILSRHGGKMLIIRGYLMWKHSCVRGTKSPKPTYYWCCERRQTLSCKGRATTRLSDAGKHVLIKFSEHNHSPSGHNAVNVSKTLKEIKSQIKNTNDLYVQVNQSFISSVPSELSQSMPFEVNVRQKITEIPSSERTIVKKQVIISLDSNCIF